MSENNGDKKPIILTPATLMPFGMTVVVVLSLWRGMSYLDDKFRKMENTIMAIEMELKSINSTLLDRWTVQDMKLWEQELKIRNPTLVVPDAYEVSGRPRAIGTR